MAKPKIAIIHDAFAVRGGAEKVAYYISKVFPEAPIYTTVYFQDKTFEELKEFLQNQVNHTKSRH